MCSGHGCLCVCLSVCLSLTAFKHYCTNCNPVAVFVLRCDGYFDCLSVIRASLAMVSCTMGGVLMATGNSCC